MSQIFINGREFLIIHSSERTPWHLFSELRAAEIDAGTLVANATKAVNRPPPQDRNWQRRDFDTGAHASVTGREPISRKIANNFAKSRKRAGVLCTRLNARLHHPQRLLSASAWLLIDSKRSERVMSKLNGACAAASNEAAMSDPLPITEAMMGGRADFDLTIEFRGMERVSPRELWEPAGSYRRQRLCRLGAASQRMRVRGSRAQDRVRIRSPGFRSQCLPIQTHASRCSPRRRGLLLCRISGRWSVSTDAE